jgi:hypothetical protein
MQVVHVPPVGDYEQRLLDEAYAILQYAVDLRDQLPGVAVQLALAEMKTIEEHVESLLREHVAR